MSTHSSQLRTLPQTSDEGEQRQSDAVDKEQAGRSIGDAGPDADHDIAPEGGAQAWLVAAGGAAIFFCTLGFGNSFGAFQEYYTSNMMIGESASSISWIGSLASFLQFLAGMLGGPLFDRYGTGVSCPALGENPTQLL